jgi:hypothetical protein
MAVTALARCPITRKRRFAAAGRPATTVNLPFAKIPGMANSTARTCASVMVVMMMSSPTTADESSGGDQSGASFASALSSATVRPLDSQSLTSPFAVSPGRSSTLTAIPALWRLAATACMSARPGSSLSGKHTARVMPAAFELIGVRRQPLAGATGVRRRREIVCAQIVSILLAFDDQDARPLERWKLVEHAPCAVQ